MRIFTTFLIVLTLTLFTGYKSPADSTATGNTQHIQADPNADKEDAKLNDGDFTGNWVSKYTSMHAWVARSRYGYYVQYSIDNGNGVEFCGHYKFKGAVYRGKKEVSAANNSVLVCDDNYYDNKVKNTYPTLDNHFVVNSQDGILNNEFVNNSSFKMSGNSLVFGCDRCETTVLYKVK